MKHKIQIQTAISDRELESFPVRWELIESEMRYGLAYEIQKSGKLKELKVLREGGLTKFTATLHIFTEGELEEYYRQRLSRHLGQSKYFP